MKRAQRPTLITDAPLSPSEELRRRQIRYAIMMGFRTVCVILAGVLVLVRAPLLALWLPLCGVGMVVLPWLAVILANDRAPKEKHRLAHKLHRGPLAEETPPQALPAPPDGRVIDAEP